MKREPDLVKWMLMALIVFALVVLVVLAADAQNTKTPIYNGILQSNLDANGFSIVNLVGGGGGGGITSLTATTPIVVTPSPVIATGVISIADTAVIPGSYTNTNLTVDAKGRITAASNGAGGGAVTSVFTRTGAVVAAANDYSFSQLSGVAATAQGGVPTGGTTSQVLKKNSNTNYDYAWAADATAGGATWGSITGTLSSQTDLQTALDAKLATAGDLSPLFTTTEATQNVAFALTSAAATTVFGRAAGTSGAPTYSSAPQFLKIGNLTTNGFVKTGSSDGTLSVDTATYLTTASAASTYQPLDTDLTTFAGITPTTVGQSFLTLVNPSAITFPEISATNVVSTKTAAQLKTDLSLTATDVGLGNVTNNAQTQAAIVPNTAPSAGQILIGNAGNTAYAKNTLSGSGATMSLGATGVLTISAIPESSLSITNITTGDATTSAHGFAPKGTVGTTQFWRQDWTLATPGGTGTVTATGGALTANSVMLGAGTTDTKVVGGIVTDGAAKLTLGVSTTSVGTIDLKNLTSGTVTITPATGALGTATMTIPAGSSNPVIADTGTANNFLTAISSAGAISKARPAIATLSDAGTLATWAVVTPGTNVTTFLATPSSANLRGALTDENGTGAALFSGATTPDFTTGFTVGAAAASRKILVGNGTNYVPSTETWAVPGASTNNVLKSDGTNWTAAQLAFSNLSGSATAAQMPAFTGDVTSTAGATANTLVNIPLTTTIAGAAGAQGDVLYYGATGWAKLAAGTNGNQLTTHGAAANPTWDAPGSGGSGSPGGSNTQVQYNNSGAFGGITNATTDGTTMTLTSPKIVTSVLDTNANTLLGITATASAVNYLKITNAATGADPVISAEGTNANIDINIVPKASGWVQISTNTAANLPLASTGFGVGIGIHYSNGFGEVDFLNEYASSGATSPKFIFYRSDGGAEFDIGDYGATAGANGLFRWSSVAVTAGVPTFAAADTAIARNAAGVVEVNNGTAGTYRDLKARTVNVTSDYQINGTSTAGDYINSSVSSQTPSTADVYLTGSNVVVPAGAFKAKGQYRCLFDVVKSAGTGTIVLSVRTGTAGTTADVANLTFTFPAGTSVADTGTMEVFVNWRTVGTGTSAVVSGVCRAFKNTITAAGLWNDTSAAKTIVATVSSGFNSSTFTNMGVSFNGGTAFAGTITTVQASLNQ